MAKRIKEYFVHYMCSTGYGNVDANGNFKSIKDVRALEKSIEKEHNLSGVTVVNWIEFPKCQNQVTEARHEEKA